MTTDTTTGRREMKLVWRPVAELRKYERNSRTHSTRQIEQLAASIKAYGWTNPLLVDADGTVIAGHGRLAAAVHLGLEEVPPIELGHLSEHERRAYVVADNALAEQSGWDRDLLRIELAELKAVGFAIDLLGLKTRDVRELLKPLNVRPGADDLAPPEDDVAPRSQAGDVWLCGDHRVMCGDSTAADQVATLCAGQTADLIHADPPYGMGKSNEGVANDNIYGAELDQFQVAWWRAFRPHAKANGSAYIWGNAPDLWRLWYQGGLGDSEPLTLRNEIVWSKGAIPGQGSPDLTQYPEASERCLFFQFGRHVFLVNQTKDDFWEGWAPLQEWLRSQADAAGLTAKRCREICGNFMYSHWFSRTQWSMPSRENYELLQAAFPGQAFDRPYDDLQTEYQAALKVFRGEVRDPRFAEFAAARPYFDNAHDVMADVWEFPRVTGDERHGHATPKPVDMMQRAIVSSTRPGELVLEPFGGSGSTLIAAERAGRRCFTMELQPRYVDIIVRRWQAFSGKAALREADGKPFDTLEAAA